MRILIAEDDKNISTILAITLEQIGDHKVTAVENGQLAINELKQQAYDLILMDAMMPEKDGATACQEIKETMGITTPVIFLTAKTDETSVNHFYELGAIGVIAKPFEPISVCDEIFDILKDRGLIAC
tara:strand:+ start:6871 stop:7251 length:381 start_codon:yes stop_codon:yes gene_type:complete